MALLGNSLTLKQAHRVSSENMRHKRERPYFVTQIPQHSQNNEDYLDYIDNRRPNSGQDQSATEVFTACSQVFIHRVDPSESTSGSNHSHFNFNFAITHLCIRVNYIHWQIEARYTRFCSGLRDSY